MSQSDFYEIGKTVNWNQLVLQEAYVATRMKYYCSDGIQTKEACPSSFHSFLLFYPIG
jgi:hypothetical protein